MRHRLRSGSAIDLGAENLVNEAASFGFGTLSADRPAYEPILRVVHDPDTHYPVHVGTLVFEQTSRSSPTRRSVRETWRQLPSRWPWWRPAIADDGVIMTPHVMAKILDPKDNVVQTYQPTTWLRATSPQTASAVSSLMQGVVSSPTAPRTASSPRRGR